MLRAGELCLCQVTAILRLAPSTVSAHLKELRAGGLIEERKEGRWVFSRLTQDPAAGRLLEHVWEQLSGDPTVHNDARLLRKLLRVDVQTLCRADLDLERLGIAPGRCGAVEANEHTTARDT